MERNNDKGISLTGGGGVKTPDDGQRNCPKHVEFHSKNKFEKLVHLVGFIIRIYHDAQSPERQILLHCRWVSLWYPDYKQTKKYLKLEEIRSRFQCPIDTTRTDGNLNNSSLKDFLLSIQRV